MVRSSSKSSLIRSAWMKLMAALPTGLQHEETIIFTSGSRNGWHSLFITLPAWEGKRSNGEYKLSTNKDWL